MVRGVAAGDQAVGKSAITQVFHSDGKHFPEKYNMVCTLAILPMASAVLCGAIINALARADRAPSLNEDELGAMIRSGLGR